MDPGTPRRGSSASPTLVWALAGCLALALAAWFARRTFDARGVAPVALQPVTEAALPTLAVSPPEERFEEREALASAPAASAPALEPARLTGRLQVNGYAARRGRAWLRTPDGTFVRELAIDEGGRFYCEALPAGPLRVGFEAEGLFERTLLLPDHLPVETRAGELAVLDLDWWTRQVNVVVHSEDGWSGPARIGVSGPGYDAEVQVDESGSVKLDLVGEGIFTFRATTPGGLVAAAELELEPGDGLDTAVLVARIKEL